MSKNFNKIKKYYENGMWTKAQVRAVVGKANGITINEYELITNEVYDNMQ